MSRLVKLQGTPSDGRETSRATEEGESYAERAAKYVPAEIVAGYVALASLVQTIQEPDRLTASWAIFGIALVATPIYLYKSGNPQGQQWWQVIISTVAFVIWAYTLGGPFESLPNYKPWVGGLIVGVYTFLAGLFQPKQPEISVVVPTA